MLEKLKNVCHKAAYPQLSAEELLNLVCDSDEICLLPSSKSDKIFTSYELGKDFVSDSEVITLGRARYANIKYHKGKFISSNNIIIESKDQNYLLTKYLYYFLLFTSKNYYVETTSYPKFDLKAFEETLVEIPSIDVQEKRISYFENLYYLIESETKLISLFDELIKSRFNEMFGNAHINKMNFPVLTLAQVAQKIVVGGDKPTKVSLKCNKKFKYPIYSNGEINNGLFGYSKEFKIKDPAITISARGTIGYSVFRNNGKFTPIVRLLTIIPNKKINPIYLTYCLNINRLGGIGSGVKQLTKPMIKKIHLIVPPINLQNEFELIENHINKLKFNEFIIISTCFIV